MPYRTISLQMPFKKLQLKIFLEFILKNGIRPFSVDDKPILPAAFLDEIGYVDSFFQG